MSALSLNQLLSLIIFSRAPIVMIAHDFFTISFMKEAVGKFRSWLDDLLATAWKACQNTDVLIESPSAMAGYHIAEALQIPYYR